MGGYVLSNRLIFFAAALLVVPAALGSHSDPRRRYPFWRSLGRPDHHEPTAPPRARRAMLWKDRSLLPLAACLFPFQLPMRRYCPLIGEILPHYVGWCSSLTMSVLVIVPPGAGRRSRFIGTVSSLGASVSTTVSRL